MKMKWRLTHKQVLGAFIRIMETKKEFRRVRNRKFLKSRGFTKSSFNGPDLVYQEEAGMWGFEIKPSYINSSGLEKGLGQCAMANACGLYSYIVIYEQTFMEAARIISLIKWLGIIVYNNRLDFKVLNQAPGVTLYFPSELDKLKKQVEEPVPDI